MHLVLLEEEVTCCLRALAGLEAGISFPWTSARESMINIGAFLMAHHTIITIRNPQSSIGKFGEGKFCGPYSRRAWRRLEGHTRRRRATLCFRLNFCVCIHGKHYHCRGKSDVVVVNIMALGDSDQAPS